MATRKRDLSQADKRKREKEAKRREKERAAADKRRKKLQQQEAERKRRARERKEIQKDREKLAVKVKKARQRAAEIKRKSNALKRRGDAIKAAVLRAADRRLQKAIEQLDYAKAALLRTKRRSPGRKEQFEQGVHDAQMGQHESQLRDTFDMYLALREEGEIKGGRGEVVREMDLESSRHGAIMEYRIPIGDKLDEATIGEAVYRAEKALAEMKKWHKYVYTNIHMYQSEPTYDTSTDKGKTGASPDGWIKERGPKDAGDLWSTWQGIPTTEIGPQLPQLIQSKLEGVVDSQGKRTVSILHEIVIRSMTEEELGRMRKRRAPIDEDEGL